MRGNHINWNQLFYFSQIALHGSLKKAAKRLGLSPSTLSEHLAQLESDLNVALFHRQPRKIALTPAGARLFQHVKDIFDVGLRMIDVVSPLSLGNYPLALAVAPGGNVVVISKILQEYIKTFGMISAQVHQVAVEKIEKGLIDAEYDFAITHRPAEGPALVTTEISSYPVGLFTTKEQSKKGLRKILYQLPLLLPVADGPQRLLANHLMAALDIPMSSTIQSDYISVLLALCRAGQGVGVFNTDWIRRHHSDLVEIALEDTAPSVFDRTYILWAKGAENSATIRHLTVVLKQIRMDRPDILNKILTQRSKISTKRQIRSPQYFPE